MWLLVGIPKAIAQEALLSSLSALRLATYDFHFGRLN